MMTPDFKTAVLGPMADTELGLSPSSWALGSLKLVADASRPGGTGHGIEMSTGANQAGTERLVIGTGAGTRAHASVDLGNEGIAPSFEVGDKVELVVTEFGDQRLHPVSQRLEQRPELIGVLGYRLDDHAAPIGLVVSPPNVSHALQPVDEPRRRSTRQAGPLRELSRRHRAKRVEQVHRLDVDRK